MKADIQYTPSGPYSGEKSSKGGVHISRGGLVDDHYTWWVDASGVGPRRFRIQAYSTHLDLQPDEVQALRNAMTAWLVREGHEREVAAAV